MLTIFGLDESISFEEIGALELLRSAGVPVRVLLSPRTTEAGLHVARAILSQFYVDVKLIESGDLDSSRVVVSFGREDLFSLMRNTGERPEKVIYGLPTLHASKKEIAALSEGLIDEVFTQSPRRAFSTVTALVKSANRGVEHRTGYVPFCNTNSDYTGLRFSPLRAFPEFAVMRYTNDDESYAFDDFWSMMARVTVPADRQKSFRIINWGRRLSSAYGNPCHQEDKWHGEFNLKVGYQNPAYDSLKKDMDEVSTMMCFYPKDDVFSFEAAMAIISGVVVVSSPLPAFYDLLTHGETGYHASTSDEAAYLTSKLAWEPYLRAKIAANAYNWFVTKGPGNPDNCLPWWKPIIEWTT